MEVQDDEAAKSGLAKLCPSILKPKYEDVVELKEGKTHKWLNTTTRDQPDTFPAWRTSGEDAPVDGVQDMTSAEVAAGADQESASAEVAADAEPAGNQDPEAEGGQPTDPEAPPISVGRCSNLMSRRRRRKWHTIKHKLIGAKIAYVDADMITKAACVDAAGMTLTECGRTMMRETQTNSSSKQ